MAIGKITKRSVEATVLPEEGGRSYLWDETLKGFGVMVTDKGSRSYIVQYRIGGRAGKTRRVTIGKHGSPWTAERARDRAAALLEQVRIRIDPFDAAQAATEADRAKKASQANQIVVAERLGFSVFASRFVEKYAKPHMLRSWKEVEALIDRELKPVFGSRSLIEITDADIVELIDTISERSPSAAHKAFGVLRQIFGYACDKERRHFPPAMSPMLGLKSPPNSKKRDRVLSDTELRFVWAAAETMGWPFGSVVHLLILTGQRRDEVAGIPWPEIDKKDRSWLLPAERSKNSLENFVPLSSQAMAIIDAVPVLKSERQLLFSTTGKTPVSGFSKAKKRLDAKILELMRKEAEQAGATEDEIAKLIVKPWRLHDLRRTLATGCQKLKVPTEVTEAILNHVSGSQGGIVGVYQTYKYADEKRAALSAWGSRVMKIVSGKSLPKSGRAGGQKA